MLRQVRSERKELQAERDRLFQIGEQRFTECEYAAAMHYLEQIPEGMRDQPVEELMAITAKSIRELADLSQAIPVALREERYQDLRPLVESYLHLKPEDPQANQLLKRLKRHEATHAQPAVPLQAENPPAALSVPAGSPPATGNRAVGGSRLGVSGLSKPRHNKTAGLGRLTSSPRTYWIAGAIAVSLLSLLLINVFRQYAGDVVAPREPGPNAADTPTPAVALPPSMSADRGSPNSSTSGDRARIVPGRHADAANPPAVSSAGNGPSPATASNPPITAPTYGSGATPATPPSSDVSKSPASGFAPPPSESPIASSTVPTTGAPRASPTPAGWTNLPAQSSWETDELRVPCQTPDDVVFGPIGCPVFVVNQDVWHFESKQIVQTLQGNVPENGLRRAVGQWVLVRVRASVSQPEGYGDRRLEHAHRRTDP